MPFLTDSYPLFFKNNSVRKISAALFAKNRWKPQIFFKKEDRIIFSDRIFMIGYITTFVFISFCFVLHSTPLYQHSIESLVKHRKNFESQALFELFHPIKKSSVYMDSSRKMSVIPLRVDNRNSGGKDSIGLIRGVLPKKKLDSSKPGAVAYS